VHAFTKSIAECGIALESDWLVAGDHTLEGGIGAMEKILAGPRQPTGIMCSNDMTALGVLHKAYRAGLRVPQDLSVIGFDDIHMARVMIPPLTSIQMSRVELSRAAVSALRAHVEGTGQQREYRIDTQLVVRESTSFPPGTMQDLNGHAGNS
jgi:LacI family transcriptional regulator